jgi:hypothetical protein
MTTRACRRIDFAPTKECRSHVCMADGGVVACPSGTSCAASNERWLVPGLPGALGNLPRVGLPQLRSSNHIATIHTPRAPRAGEIVSFVWRGFAPNRQSTGGDLSPFWPHLLLQRLRQCATWLELNQHRGLNIRYRKIRKWERSWLAASLNMPSDTREKR